jgi:hypothetical protein
MERCVASHGDLPSAVPAWENESGRSLSPAVDNQHTPGLGTAAKRAVRGPEARGGFYESD